MNKEIGNAVGHVGEFCKRLPTRFEYACTWYASRLCLWCEIRLLRAERCAKRRGGSVKPRWVAASNERLPLHLVWRHGRVPIFYVQEQHAKRIPAAPAGKAQLSSTRAIVATCAKKLTRSTCENRQVDFRRATSAEHWLCVFLNPLLRFACCSTESQTHFASGTGLCGC